MEFINEEFFRKIFNKKKTNKSSKKSRLDTCLFNIREFLTEYEDKEENEKCAQIIKKISSK